MSRPAARRAATRGEGWYGFFTNPELTARSLGWIREAVAAGERPADLGPLEISVTPPPPITEGLVKQYAELGVHRIIGLAPAGFAGPRDVDGMLRFVDELAELAAAAAKGMTQDATIQHLPRRRPPVRLRSASPRCARRFAALAA